MIRSLAFVAFRSGAYAFFGVRPLSNEHILISRTFFAAHSAIRAVEVRTAKCVALPHQSEAIHEHLMKRENKHTCDRILITRFTSFVSNGLFASFITIAHDGGTERLSPLCYDYLLLRSGQRLICKLFLLLRFSPFFLRHVASLVTANCSFHSLRCPPPRRLLQPAIRSAGLLLEIESSFVWTE